MSNHQEYKPPETKERLGCLGYAIGLIIIFPFIMVLYLIPGIIEILHLYLYVEPDYTWQYLLSQIYPIFLAIPFFFVPRRKSRI
jgi:uncharacterized membrane protein HdeD (DUF308 family)